MKWQRWYLVLWCIVLGIVLGVEVYAFVLWQFGVRGIPTLSEIIVTGLGAPLATGLTMIIAAVLVWHWFDLSERL